MQHAGNMQGARAAHVRAKKMRSERRGTSIMANRRTSADQMVSDVPFTACASCAQAQPPSSQPPLLFSTFSRFSTKFWRPSTAPGAPGESAPGQIQSEISRKFRGNFAEISSARRNFDFRETRNRRPWGSQPQIFRKKLTFDRERMN